MCAFVCFACNGGACSVVFLCHQVYIYVTYVYVDVRVCVCTCACVRMCICTCACVHYSNNNNACLLVYFYVCVLIHIIVKRKCIIQTCMTKSVDMIFVCSAK